MYLLIKIYLVGFFVVMILNYVASYLNTKYKNKLHYKLSIGLALCEAAFWFIGFLFAFVTIGQILSKNKNCISTFFSSEMYKEK